MQTPKLLILFKLAPKQVIETQQALDFIFAASGFYEELVIVFINEGVSQLLQNKGAEITSLQKQFRAFDVYEINQVYVCNNSIKQYAKAGDQLITSAQAISSEEINLQQTSANQTLVF